MARIFWLLCGAACFLNVWGVPQQVGEQNTFYFPNDDFGGIAPASAFAKNTAPSSSFQGVPPRGTTQYENYVNKIIALGVGNLTLAINNILLENENVKDNVVFSPASIAGVLALVLLGSNGKTYDELLHFMGLASGLPDLQTKPQLIHIQMGRIIGKILATSGFKIGQEVNYAMAIFVQNDYPIRPLYRQTAEEIYRSHTFNVNFQQDPLGSQRQINDWVALETKNRIRNILSEVPSQYTKVILTSAMYFKAAWKYPFYPGSTARRPFYINGRNSPTNVKADMMANGGFFPYYRDNQLGCEILGLPYQGDGSVMYVVMPANSNKDNLKNLVGKLTALDLNRLADNAKPTETVLLFPKMRLDSTINLKDAMKMLGVRSLFNPNDANLALISSGQFAQRIGIDNNLTPNITDTNCTKVVDSKTNLTSVCEDSANYTTETKVESRIGSFAAYTETLDSIRQQINSESTSNRYQNPGLYADSIIHKVYMDITETGTEAAAATAVSLSRDGNKVTFRVDVPFFFFIRHEETKLITFWGSVLTPTPSYTG